MTSKHLERRELAVTGLALENPARGDGEGVILSIVVVDATGQYVASNSWPWLGRDQALPHLRCFSSCSYTRLCKMRMFEQKGNTRDALLMLRRHRIDFNTIVDYCSWQVFLQSASEYVKQVNNLNYI
ncbi:hypothetical protein ACFX19_041926 [Malus domestica]